MPRPGIKELHCEECGKTREVEVGIRFMYCCAAKMVEVTKEEPPAAAQEEPPAASQKGNHPPGIQLDQS